MLLVPTDGLGTNENLGQGKAGKRTTKANGWTS